MHCGLQSNFWGLKNDDLQLSSSSSALRQDCLVWKNYSLGAENAGKVKGVQTGAGYVYEFRLFGHASGQLNN